MQVVTPAPAITVDEGAPGRKHILPAPVCIDRWILPRQGGRDPGRSDSRPHVVRELDTALVERSPEIGETDLGERRAPVLATLATAHHDLATVEVDILHA